ncbi:MAG: DUF3617 domain-containing protein [Bryobacteraceae bacterium]|jgi:hypothetical protein
MRNLTLSVLILLAPLACRAADDVTPLLKVKLGLWEDTVTTQSSGMPGLSEDMLARIPPERRAQMEAAMKGAMAPHTFKSCVTSDMLKKAQAFEDRPNSSCKRTITSSSPGSMEFHMECDNGKSKTVGDGHFQAVDSETMKGEINGTTTTPDGRTITSKTTISGRWLSSDCGSVQPK